MYARDDMYEKPPIYTTAPDPFSPHSPCHLREPPPTSPSIPTFPFMKHHPPLTNTANTTDSPTGTSPATCTHASQSTPPRHTAHTATGTPCTASTTGSHTRSYILLGTPWPRCTHPHRTGPTASASRPTSPHSSSSLSWWSSWSRRWYCPAWPWSWSSCSPRSRSRAAGTSSRCRPSGCWKTRRAYRGSWPGCCPGFPRTRCTGPARRCRASSCCPPRRSRWRGRGPCRGRGPGPCWRGRRRRRRSSRRRRRSCRRRRRRSGQSCRFGRSSG